MELRDFTLETIEFNHTPVLLNECIDNLMIKKDGIYVDGTLGGAGHSFEIASRLSEKGTLIGIDRDEDALNVAKERLKNFKNIKYINGNHDDIKQIIQELEIDSVDGILLDLGVSSYQLDEASRGFSYMKNSPLDMRMDKTQDFTAEDVINGYDEDKLAEIIFEYGEEQFARRIARKICEYRENKEITTTEELVKIIEEVIPAKIKNKYGHPAKRTFQAIRIEVNNEIEPLYNTVINSIKALKKRGRLCIITFHSLEDRAVKKAFIDSAESCICPKDLPYCVCNKKSLGRIITRKPILPTEEEMNLNSRSKSAKLRVFERE